jgi:cell division protein ZapA
MAQVEVHINGRNYVLACADGEEARLRQLSDYLDGRMTKLARSVGMVGEARLFLLGALMLADELAEANTKITLLSEGKSVPAEGGIGAADVQEIADYIEKLAHRITVLAEKVAA